MDGLRITEIMFRAFKDRLDDRGQLAVKDTIEKEL